MTPKAKATKAKPPTFTQRNAEFISKLKLILIVVCLAAIPLSFWLNQEDVGLVNNRVTKIESPCTRYGPESKVCQEAFETAVKSITHRIACYIDHESGRPFKPSCIGVHLRIEAPVPKLGRGAVTGDGGEAAAGESNGGDASTGHSPHSSPGPSPGGPTDNPSKPHAPSVRHHAPHGHKSGDEAPPASSTAAPPTSIIERTKETVVVEPAPAPEAEPPARTSGLGEALGDVGKVVEEPGATVEEVGHGVNEVVKETTCQLGIGQC